MTPHDRAGLPNGLLQRLGYARRELDLHGFAGLRSHVGFAGFYRYADEVRGIRAHVGEDFVSRPPLVPVVEVQGERTDMVLGAVAAAASCLHVEGVDTGHAEDAVLDLPDESVLFV